MTTGRIILLLSNLFFIKCAIAQSFQQEISFANHLLMLEEYQEASIVLETVSAKYKNPDKRDTINYLLGKTYYYQKNLEESIAYFTRVGDQSPFDKESRYLTYYQLAYLGEIDRSRKGWQSLSPEQDLNLAVVNFEQAGLALLSRNLDRYNDFSSRFSQNHYQLITSQQNLEKFATGIREFNRKSPLLAGVLSTLLPGAGKIYVGKVGEGLISFFTNGILGLQAWEGYRKDGPRSARFIIFSTAFTAFYIGNIWGSVLSVKIRNDEFNEQINESILVTMHVPLRLLFD